MTAYRSAPFRRRARLLAGCAIALGLSVQAQAQNAFQADVTGNPLGSANVTRGQIVSGRLTDIVTVNTKQAVIDWSATAAPSMDGSVNVLPTDNQLLFSADGNTVGNYTVLNRVATAAAGDPAIRFDGLVKSQLDFGYGATQPGGNILFYSPGGIIAGATSQFDVGSLVLSAADILYDPDNGIFGSDVDAQSGTLRFRPEFGDNRSTVTIEQGATLRARDNYLALVAPRVVQRGTVEAKGSIAYVAAQAADITIPMAGGLFNIGIVEGSSVDPGGETTLTHTGTTTGPESDGTIADRRIYMVALPKNDAVTMLVSGTVGYTPAANVQLADGQIILAAASSVSSSDAVSSLASGSTVQVNGGSFSSSLKVVADQITVSTAAGDFTAAGDVELRSGSGDIALTALGGNDVTIAGATLMRLDDGRAGSTINVAANIGSAIGFQNLTIESENAIGSSLAVTGGDLSIAAAGGIITAADISLSAFGQGSDTGAGTGGTIAIAASASGQILADSISAQANGAGGDSGYGAGDGTGGMVTMTASGGALIQANDIDLLAKGFGGDGGSGDADGGVITLGASNATITSGNLNLDASAIGGQAFSGSAGSATGGTVTITSGTGGQITGSGTVRANGTGGRGFSSSSAGDGTGGTVTVQLSGGNLDVSNGTARIFADGIGGNNFNGGGGATARGGTVNVSIGSASSQLAFGTLLIGADGRFDELFDGLPPPNHGGAGVGGTVNFSITAGAVQGSELEATATGSGAGSSAGGVGGSGFQGRAAFALSGGTMNVDALSILAEAFGGRGNEQGDSGYGIAAGSGGTAGVGPTLFAGEAGAILTVTGGTLDASSVDVSGDSSGGTGGDGREFDPEPLAGNGGAATGGLASFSSSGSATLSVGFLRVRANANAESDGEELFRGGSGGSIILGDSSSSDGLAGTGGASVGGLAMVTIGGSGSLAVENIEARANGFGGSAGLVADFFGNSIGGSGLGGNGGAGTGGTANILINGGISGSPTASASANGTGADGGLGPNGGNAGNGLAGSATISIASGTTTFDQIHVSSSGFGGNGADGGIGAGGSGGAGQGSNATLTIGSGAIVSTQSLALFADGEGGRGGTGSVDAVGFDGGDGGEGKGGSAAINLTEGSLTLFGGEGVPTAFISAVGRGGYGGSGGDAQEGGGGNGGDGGNATGGTATVRSTSGSLTFPLTDLTANAEAGGRGFGGLGAVNGTDGGDGTAAAGTVTIDAQHQGSGSARLDFGGAFLSADSRVDDSIEGRAGHVFVHAEGGAADGAIRFGNLDISSDGSEAAADAQPAVRLTGTGLVRADNSANLRAVGEIALSGRLSVGERLDVASNGDIKLLTGADVAVQQDILLQSGDDIIIGSGALLRGTSGAVPEAGYGGPSLDIFAGSLGRRGGVVFDDISSFILEGNIDAADRTAIVQADAVVGRTNTQFSAGNLYVLLNNIPEGGEVPPREDLGQLRPLRSLPCLEGDVCLGNVSVSGYVEIGNAFFGTPINVRLNGGLDAQRVTLLGRNVRLGLANESHFIRASERLTIASLESSLFLDGTLAIQGGSEEARIASAFNINGAKADISAPGVLDLYATNNITLGGASAQVIRTVDFEGTVLEPTGIVAPGAINLGTVSSTNAVNLRAGTGIQVAQAFTPALSMVTDEGLASLGGGTVGSASIRGDSVSASVNVTGGGGVVIDAVAGDASLGPINAFGLVVFANGNIQTNGLIDIAAVESGYGVSGGNIDFYALGDVDVGAGGQLLADQGITIQAADDVRIGAGAVLRAARNAPASADEPLFQPGQLNIEAGVVNIAAAEPVGPTNVHALLIGPDASLAGRTIVLTGQAIQAGPDSSITATNLFARISAAPPLGAAPLDDGGALIADCVRGNVCLGSIDVAEQLRIGEAEFIANRITIAGPIDAADVLLRSRDTLVLNGSLSADALSVESQSSDVVLGSGATFVTDGPMSIRAGRDLIGATASVTGTAVEISVGRDLALGALSAASLRTLDASGNVVEPSGLSAPGAITIGSLSSTGSVALSAGTDVTVGTGALAPAAAFKVVAASGDATLGTITAQSIDAKASGAISASSLTATGTTIKLDGASGVDVTSLAAAGAVTLTAASGEIAVANVLGSAGVTASGTAVDLSGSNGLVVLQATASNGDATFAATGGVLQVNDATATGAMQLTSADAIKLGQLNAGGALALQAGADITGSGQLRAGSVSAQTPGRFEIILSVQSSSGPISVVADQGIRALGFISAGGMNLEALNGAITSDQFTSGTDIVARGKSVTLVNAGALDVKQASATSGNVTLASTAGTLVADEVSASGEISLGTANKGDISFGTIVAGGRVSIGAGGSIAGGTASGSQLAAFADGAISASSLAATAGDLKVTATNGAAINSLKASGTATLSAGTGALLVANGDAASFDVSGTSVSLTSANSLTLTKGSATAGDLLLAGAQGVQIGQASATGRLAAATPGLITVSGSATAAEIAFTSSDLAIEAAGQIGSKSETTNIALTSTADRMFLGDAAGSGYRIDASELTRIASAGDISLVSAPQNIVGVNFDLLDPAGTNVVMGNFTFDGAQLGQEGKFTFSTPRAIGVTGNVQFKNFNNDQYVLYAAGTDISLAAETGLVTVKNSSGGLAGTLELRAQQVHAMSSKARAEIAGLQLNEVRQRLGTNDQLENDGGYFQANRIIVNIGRLAFIQNSGVNGTDPNAKRGITANELIINAGEGPPLQLVVNGKEGSATGEAFRSAVVLNGSIDPQSAFNGCVSGVSCIPVVDPPPPVDPGPDLELPAQIVLASSRDQIQDEEDEDEKEEALQASQTRPDPIIRLAPAPTSRLDPLIDEPVTGAGNEDLWEPTTPAGPTP